MRYTWWTAAVAQAVNAPLIAQQTRPAAEPVVHLIAPSDAYAMKYDPLAAEAALRFYRRVSSPVAATGWVPDMASLIAFCWSRTLERDAAAGQPAARPSGPRSPTATSGPASRGD